MSHTTGKSMRKNAWRLLLEPQPCGGCTPRLAPLSAPTRMRCRRPRLTLQARLKLQGIAVTHIHHLHGQP